jgi:hypothetical protein
MRSLVVRNCQENFRHSAAMRNLGRLTLYEQVLMRRISYANKADLSGICLEKYSQEGQGMPATLNSIADMRYVRNTHTAIRAHHITNSAGTPPLTCWSVGANRFVAGSSLLSVELAG